MKPLLLLIPGMLNTPAVWRHVRPLLAERAEVRVADVQTQSSIAEMARDAWTLLGDVPADVPLVLCGFSMGGYVAIEMLASARRPVAALGLLDTSAQPETPQGRAAREKTIAAMERDFDKAAAGIAQFSTAAASQSRPEVMDELGALLREVGAATAIRQNRAIMERADHRSLLAALALPVSVMCGREDRITPPALSEALAGLIPGAALEWIEDAGHMTPIEQPARVASLIGTLLGRACTGKETQA
ncbi:alpha/beta fold hydrolase [Xylophilus sp. ASV27]|uniref:alpha/beta fold hydrolase n=1 Tax=Xylophilus sp. ASV27 TaxID=2795129 RepID=UPI00351C3C77